MFTPFSGYIFKNLIFSNVDHGLQTKKFFCTDFNNPMKLSDYQLPLFKYLILYFLVIFC